MKTLLLVAMINSPFPPQALNECAKACVDSYKRELIMIMSSEYSKEERAVLDRYMQAKLKECKSECDDDGDVAVYDNH